MILVWLLFSNTSYSSYKMKEFLGLVDRARGENLCAPGQNAAWAPYQMGCERHAEGEPVRQRFKIMVATVALVTISASRYNRKIIFFWILQIFQTSKLKTIEFIEFQPIFQLSYN